MMDRWIGLAAVLLLAALLWAARIPDAEADVVTVTWTPATTDTAGALLGADTWTVVYQWQGSCPGEYQIDGAGRWNGSGPDQLQFTQAPGTCSCYEARTLALDAPSTVRMSAPVLEERCIPAPVCGGCHA